jgi:hypothetical protein
LPDAKVIDEGDLLASRGGVVHAADDGVALVREQSRDDSVEAGVREAGLDTHQPSGGVAEVDVGADRRGASVELFRRVRHVAAEVDLVRLRDVHRRLDDRPSTCSGA